MKIKDIAKISGVSPATVSRYINKNAPVSKDTAIAIDKAIHKTGYTKHLNVGLGKVGRPRKIEGTKKFASFIYCADNINADTTPLSQRLYNGMSGFFKGKQIGWFHSTFLSGMLAPKDISDPDSLGAIVRGNNESFDELITQSKNLNMVRIFDGEDDSDYDNVNPDDHLVGKRAFEVLHQRECRNLFVVGNNDTNDIHFNRQESFCSHARDAGITVTKGDITEQLDAYTKMRSTISQIKDFLHSGVNNGVFIPIVNDGPEVWLNALKHEGIPLGGKNGVYVAFCANTFSVTDAQKKYAANIDINPEEIGLQAAELLWLSQFRGKTTTKFRVLVPPVVVPFS